MRHNRSDIGLGLSGYPFKLHPGLGFGWDANISGMDPAKAEIAYKICSAATSDKDFGSTNMKVPRSKWYGVIHMDGQGDDSDNMQKSVVNNINDQIKIDMANPMFTRWDNSALGKWFAGTVKAAWEKSSWNPPASDKNLIKFGNKLAWIAYQKNFPNIWPGIYAYLSSGPVNTYKEYLDQFGIENKEAKSVAYWTANPNYDPILLRMSPEAPVKQETPPAQYDTPPAQYDTPPAQYNTPPAQHNTPPAQRSTPPAQYNTPPAQYNTPPAQYNTPPVNEETEAENPVELANNPPKQESKTALYVGAGIATILIGGAIYVLTRKK